MNYKKTITRRRFLQATAGAGLAAGAGSWTGISLASTPRRGGILRAGIGHGSTTDSLDPGSFTNGFMFLLGFMFQNNLTEIAADGELVPELAESWEASSDATEWTFKIRQGVEFHNGKTMTVDDVVASLNYHRGQDTKSAYKVLFSDVTEIKAASNDLMVVKLSSGNADFPYLLASQGLGVRPSQGGKIDPNSAIGTGGYVLEKFEPGVRAVGKRFPNYWKSDRAHFDEIHLTSILDATARLAALRSGSVDVIDKVDQKTSHRLASIDNIEVRSLPGNLHYTFASRTDTAPFDDNNVRMALKHAIDRKELVNKILHGHGAVGNDHPIGPAYRYHASDIPQRVYDPDKAKWFLKQAGLSSLKVSLSAADSAYSGAVDAVTLYSHQARSAGIEIEIDRVPNDGYWSNVWMKKPWTAVYWGGQPTASAMLTLAYSAGAPWNDTYWNNDRFNKLLKESKAELRQEKRRELFREMQVIIRDEGGTVVPMYANFVFAHSSKLSAGKLAANLDIDGYRFTERWWFA
jgi:peptide/nickel transport system substrate-binding protein